MSSLDLPYCPQQHIASATSFCPQFQLVPNLAFLSLIQASTKGLHYLAATSLLPRPSSPRVVASNLVAAEARTS